MTSVSRASGQVPIATLCSQIKAFIDKGDAASKRSDDLYLSAGRCLLELKSRAPDDWLTHAKELIGIGRTRAYELLNIAEGKATMDETRDRTGKRTKRARANSKSPLRSGRRKSEKKGEYTREQTVEQRQGEKLATQLHVFVEERFIPSVLEWTDHGERQLMASVRDDLIDMIEGSAISLQKLADTIRFDADSDDDVPEKPSRPPRPVHGEARA